MKLFRLLAAALLALGFAPQLAAQEAPASEPMPPEAVEWLKQLDPQTGTVSIPAAKASLDLGEKYVFYGSGDSFKILTEAWGNPPAAAEGVLGMVMPAGSTPFDDTWGAVISFEDIGYVEDDDAAEVDFDDLLEQLQEGTEAANEGRIEAGYEAIELVGWAARPVYDRGSHSVVWAKNLHFAGFDGPNTLNYDLRTLGRYGVLSMNVVSSMDQISSVRDAANTLAKQAHFDAGARYSDFDASSDRVAEYGIGGLIAAGAGVAAAKKLGIFAILLKFLKPILIGIAVFFGAFWKKILRLFGVKGEEDYEAEWEESYEAERGDEAVEPQPVIAETGEPGRTG